MWDELIALINRGLDLTLEASQKSKHPADVVVRQMATSVCTASTVTSTISTSVSASVINAVVSSNVPASSAAEAAAANAIAEETISASATHSVRIIFSKLKTPLHQSLELCCFCEAEKSNAINEECVCRGTPSIGIITNSGLNYDVKLSHYLL